MLIKNNVTVIIPAYNEEKNIGNVISSIKNNKNVDEIIVVNNMSTDNTEEVSKNNGAKVILCKQRGKGYAMQEGLKKAKNEIIVYLDADVKYDNNDIIDTLLRPIFEENVDFVKSTFDRTTGGKVTQLVTKPLLDILFSNMYKFSEPLSGMIASKKSILEKIEFEKDYGVDIGILLDIINDKAKVKEVNIGVIQNLSHLGKTNDSMVEMSYQVMKAILKRTNIKE